MRPLQSLLFPVVLFAVTTQVSAQTSVWLSEPDRLIDYVRSNADFWLQTYDTQRGGFYTNVGRDGSILSTRGTNKDVLTQSRNAYAMVRAFQLTGDEKYLDHARGALDFMYAHGWDQTYGGWRNNITALGIPYNVNQAKTAFIQHYALLGPLAMMEATAGTNVDSTWYRRGYDYVNTVMWDARPGFEGYFDEVDWQSQNPSGKSFNATVDALTTHALTHYLRFGDNGDRLAVLSDNITDRLVASMPDQAIGFAEQYDSDWNIDATERLTIMGHVLKTSWVSARLAPMAPWFDRSWDELRTASSDLLDHVLERGYDHTYGGPYKDFDRVTGEMQLWGLPDTTKAWWQMQQAVMAGLISRDLDDQEMADASLSFFMEHFVDPTYGEVYADRTRRGDGIPQWGDHKGDGFKAGYHSVELAWYSLLYHQVLHGRGPLTLYYRIQPVAHEQELSIAPFEEADSRWDRVLDARVRVTTAVLEGNAVEIVDGYVPSVIIPAGAGGVLAVQLRTVGAAAVEPVTQAEQPTLSAWPNPFTDFLHVGWNEGPVNVVLRDAMGRVVWHGVAASGMERIDTSALAPGLYFLSVHSRTGLISRPMVHVR